MIKNLSILFCFTIFFTSCDLIESLESKKTIKKELIATVGSNKFYKEDLIGLIPANISNQDSVLLSKSIIKNWAINQLMVQKSLENLSVKNLNNIDELVKKYKQSLLVNNYKEKLIKQRLDTVISNEEIVEYYSNNERNFKLNENLVQLKYLKFSKNLTDKKEVVKAFISDDLEDVEFLQFQELSFKEMDLNDSIWRSLDNVMLKLPFSRTKLLKKSKFIQKEISLDLYLAVVKNVLKRGDLAPISYISPTIKQLILHKRKLELVREIEKNILKNATQNKDFQEY